MRDSVIWLAAILVVGVVLSVEGKPLPQSDGEGFNKEDYSYYEGLVVILHFLEKILRASCIF
jgi:hypothetical protein